MDCHNCGAPMTWVAGATTLNCPYCRTATALPSDRAGLDRVQRLGSPADENCPDCQLLLEQVAVEGVPAAYCGECHGLLLANESFAWLVQQRRAAFQGAEQTPIPLTPERLQGAHACPRCHQTMDRHCYAGPGCQVIDFCNACEVVWLDGGELAAIEAAPGRRGRY